MRQSNVACGGKVEAKDKKSDREPSTKFRQHFVDVDSCDSESALPTPAKDDHPYNSQVFKHCFFG